MKRILIALLVLLSSLMPVAGVSAAEPMEASGTVTSISEPVERPAGSSGNIIVFSRDIIGTFTGGELSGDFIMTYKANVELATQSGNFNGTLTVGSYIFKVNGKVEPVQLLPVPETPGAYICLLKVNGNWSLKDNDAATGTFTATIYFVPTAEGHVDYVLPGSTFSMSGVW